jgi:TPR repeat protein
MNPKPNSVKSQFQLGYELAYGRKNHKAPPPWNEILALWRPAAEKGHVRAMFYTGVCYDHGRGTRKNLKSAFNWYLNVNSGDGNPSYRL